MSKDSKRNREANAIVKMTDALVTELRPFVSDIEGQRPTTQNHYGKYLALISSLRDSFADSTILTPKFLGGVLIKAGANTQGVRSAVDLSY